MVKRPLPLLKLSLYTKYQKPDLIANHCCSQHPCGPWAGNLIWQPCCPKSWTTLAKLHVNPRQSQASSQLEHLTDEGWSCPCGIVSWESRNYLSSNFCLRDRNLICQISPKLQKTEKSDGKNLMKKWLTSSIGLYLVPPLSLLPPQAHFIISHPSHPGQSSLWLLEHFYLALSDQCLSLAPHCPSTLATQWGPSPSVLYIVPRPHPLKTVTAIRWQFLDKV